MRTSQIFSAGLPVGSICQVPYSVTDPAWLLCDGRAVLRTTYPRLSACLPNVGLFTYTSRTKSAAPTSNAIANNGSLWCVTGAVGTSNIYSTPDGITFTARTTPASCDIRSIVHDGTNFVGANAIAGGGAMQYSSNGTAWSTSATATVVAPTSGSQTCMAWASSLGTVGRFCLASGGNPFYTSDDRGVTWTSRNPGLGATYHVCWTGQKYISTFAVNNQVATSTDGITWTAQNLPVPMAAATASQGAIISDGNGKVLIVESGAGGRILTSTDHGATWSHRQFVAANGGTSAVVNFNAGGCTPSYTNGRFFITGNGPGSAPCTWVSSDLVSWVLLDYTPTVTVTSTWSYKSGVYLINGDNTTVAAMTATEDTTYMRLPFAAQAGGGTGNNFQPFIKVQ